jgi:hypothetical protein
MSELIENLTISDEVAAANSKRYSEFVARFQGCTKRTAEGLIDLVTTVAEAQDQLPPRHFARFCHEMKLPEGSKFRKWKKLGEKAARFRAVIDRLPCNWTTLYLLALLTDEQFDLVQQDPLFGPAMTAEHVRLITGKRKEREFKPMAKLAIDMSGLTEQEQEALRDALKDLKERFKVTFKMLVGKTAADRAAAAEAEARLKAPIAELEAEPAGAV